ncbi:Ser/Thr kinase [Mollivirus sibericum]|uniref:serine-threonine kinase n=1 Tax=Mollivirus sibericum TaxID=1678078 RepID=UPI0006B2D9EB|nr:serine-threonine kinase [Mollivirus sibericum]ALD61916.1 Ser/Thr kinase [Mollivirus sibericum]
MSRAGTPSESGSIALFLVVVLAFVAMSMLLVDPVSAEGVATSINVTGSKSAGRLMQALSDGYRNHNEDTTVVYTANGETIATTQSPETVAGIFALGIKQQELDFYNISSLPLTGQAMTMSYHLPEFNATDPPLVIDGPTLAAIWIGNISKWNDPLIAALNPELAPRLPDANITIGYFDDFYLGQGMVVQLALTKFAPAFGEEFAQRGNLFGQLRPALEGRAVSLDDSSANHKAWLVGTPYGLTYVDYSDMVDATSDPQQRTRYMPMYNRAGNLVYPSIASTQATMRDFKDQFAANDLTVQIVDAPGNESWPLVFMISLSMGRNLFMDDCSVLTSWLQFIAWAQTNDRAKQTMIDLSHAPLDNNIKKRVLDALPVFYCNGQQSYTSGLVIGYGATLTLAKAMANLWTTPTSVLGYYLTNSSEAKDLQINYSGDFGVTITGVEPSYQAAMSDLAVMPMFGFAVVPAYHLTQIKDGELVLDYETIAHIYLGNISHWDDPRIATLNSPSVMANLTNTEISVVVHDVDSDYNLIFTTLLSARVPEFAQIVGASRRPAFAGLAQRRNATTLYVDQDFGVVDKMVTQSSSFAMWPRFGLSLASGFAVIRAASLQVSPALPPVRASIESVRAAINDHLDSGNSYASTQPVLSTATGAWPLVALANMVYRSSSMPDCTKARSLADFMRWSQTSASVRDAASKQQYVLASDRDSLLKQQQRLLARFACNDAKVSALAACIDPSTGIICSDRGTCNTESGRCSCPKDWEGSLCQYAQEDSSSSDSLVIGLAIGIPSAFALLICLAASAIILAFVLTARRRSRAEDWEVDPDEIELGEELGQGGYGMVRRGMWRNGEVAVKMIAVSGDPSKEMVRNFQEEVTTMSRLRHPNVVLFMGACTKPPRMCLVMEYMCLGSLYDLLHNELVPEIPFMLKIKMAYQASKGMHFLHSSGIVHRDMKSLNLLLDNKWNVKVSDFGLTKFKSEMAKGQNSASKHPIGTVHWTAPEVLNETPSADLILADVYSFGIILWELLTREQPYLGLSPAAVAVAVIRDDMRPALPEVTDATGHYQEYIDLIKVCWHIDPVIRPTFLEIMTRLSTMGDGSLSQNGMFGGSTSNTSSSSDTGGIINHRRAPASSWTLPSGGSKSSSLVSSNSSEGGEGKNRDDVFRNAGKGVPTVLPVVRPPKDIVTIVFSDITRAASLWDHDPQAMRDATLIHNDIIRSSLQRHQGYEVVLHAAKKRHSQGHGAALQVNGGEGSFCLAFQHADDALAWCADVQQALLAADWPEAILDHPGAEREFGDTDDRTIYCGLRVRMGIHMGTPRTTRDKGTGLVFYSGSVVDTAGRITTMTHGGQIILSHEVCRALGRHHEGRFNITDLGEFDIGHVRGDDDNNDEPPSPPSHNEGLVRLYELKVRGLEARFFGGVSGDAQTDSNSNGETDSGSNYDSLDHRKPAALTVIGEGLAHKEDTFLASANLCRWILNYDDIKMGRELGQGSYGVVSEGKWKGVGVAVKRFIKQKLDEKRVLEFRAEMAILAELRHPNVVLFFGACIQRPNLCIVTELIPGGNLDDLLANGAVKLTWKDKLGLMHSTALGIAYLHSLRPAIVHRDIKPSNLLVDVNAEGQRTIKVADFGFAHIKEENVTMTRAGTPCWMAPEIMRNEKHDEKVDVYSFGIVAWQIVTRKKPFAGRNFMGVSLDVLEGRRPQIPDDTPATVKKLIKMAWHAKPSKRPSMDNIIKTLDDILQTVPRDSHV